MTALLLQLRIDATISALEDRIALSKPGDIIVDGTMYSPSDRALPGAEAWYQRCDSDDLYDDWWEYAEAIKDWAEAKDIYWSDGCLVWANSNDQRTRDI